MKLVLFRKHRTHPYALFFCMYTHARIALEHQYQLGLESLSEVMPEIKVDLVFRQQQLQVMM